MSRYNLIDESWIPVLDLQGQRMELGIRDILLRARELSAIEDTSPLVVASIHRFLLAVLYRALMGPTDIDQAKILFQDGFPEDKITAYLEKWRERFWLFDDRYPFFQIPTFKPKTRRAWTVLAAEHNADNAKVLFDHIDVMSPGSASEASITRWILATQTFSISAGKSEIAHTGTSPSATAVMVFPVGATLLDTLLFCLIPQNREVIKEDRPIWEREPETIEELKKGPKRSSSGLADLYTWRGRSICLDNQDQQGITNLAFASGVGYEQSVCIDPMLGHRVDEKRGKLPVQFRERGLWRDFDSLLPDDSKLSPLVIDHAIELTRKNKSRYPRTAMILGMRNDQAKIIFWRMERFTLPEKLLGDNSIRSEIKALLMIAEESGKSLRETCSSFARHTLAPGGRKLDPKAKDIPKFIGQMSSIPWYWSTLERQFHGLLQKYTLDIDPEEIEKDWLIDVRDALADAWKQDLDMVSTGNAWAIRALVKAESSINKKLAELNKKIQNLQKEIE